MSATHAAQLALDFFEREYLPELVLDLAECLKADPAMVHAYMAEAWAEFRASRERMLARQSAAADGIGEPVGRA